MHYRNKNMIIQYVLIFGLVLLDQLVKWWTVSNLPLYTDQSIIDNILSLFYIQNDGAAWGILSGQMWLFYIITVVVIIGLFYMLHTDGKQHVLLRTALSFLIGGAIGNFIDRLHLNYVIDMFRLKFINFPIFNIADVALTIGVILLIFYVFFGNHELEESE